MERKESKPGRSLRVYAGHSSFASAPSLISLSCNSVPFLSFRALLCVQGADQYQLTGSPLPSGCQWVWSMEHRGLDVTLFSLCLITVDFSVDGSLFNYSSFGEKPHPPVFPLLSPSDLVMIETSSCC